MRETSDPREAVEACSHPALNSHKTQDGVDIEFICEDCRLVIAANELTALRRKQLQVRTTNIITRIFLGSGARKRARYALGRSANVPLRVQLGGFKTIKGFYGFISSGPVNAAPPPALLLLAIPYILNLAFVTVIFVILAGLALYVWSVSLLLRPFTK